jgi:hypothetical protein
VTNNYYVVDNHNHNHHHDRDDGHNVNRNRVFGNARYNGVTYVAHQNFVDGRFEHPRAVDPSKLRSIHPVRGIVPAVPTDANLRFSDRPVSAHLAVAPAMLGGTFAGNTIAVRRIPFAQQREALTSGAGVRVASPAQPAAVRRIPVTTGTTTTTVPVTVTNDAHVVRDVHAPRDVNDPWARFGASRGTPVTHTATSAGAVTSPNAATATTGATTAARVNTTVAPRNAQEPDAWRHFDQTRPSGARDAAPARSADTRRATSVQEPPRSYNPPHETREYNAPHQQQQAPPAQAQQRSAPPPARTEHPPAAKTTTPH